MTTNGNGHNKLKLEEVIIRGDLYPRLDTSPHIIEVYKENLEVLPPIEVNQRNELIDGRHRLTAYKAADHEYIPVTITETGSDAELLLLACQRNASHGQQLANTDKQRMTREIYSRASDKDRPALKQQLPSIMSVTPRTITSWVSRIDKDRQAELRQIAFDLWLACHTQEEITERLNIPQQTISRMVQEDFTQIGKLSELGKTAAAFGDFTPPIYNVWKNQNKSEGVKHPGNSEPAIVENLLHAYTDPFDVVVDPFAGGGSTIDLCKRRFRRYFVSDLTPIVSREQEIRQHDITEGFPKVPRWEDVRLVYLDPPYWKQAEGWYSDSPANLANMEADDFHTAVSKIIAGFAGKLQTGAKIALLMQPTQWKAPERGFVDHTLLISKAVDLPVIQRVQCPYESQQATAQMVEWAKANKQWLVLSRELTVWEVK